AHGADPNKPAREGITPLMEAAIAGQVKATRILLDHGALVDAQDSLGNTALMHAAFVNGDTLALATGPKVAKVLVDRGASTAMSNKKGTTPLLSASASGQLEIARLLLAKGATVNQKDKGGSTAIDYANAADRGS